MAIAASGAVSFSDLRTEFVGGSSAISYSDLYRGGSNIRAKAANNTGVNLAASVPTSGTINIANFRSQAKGFRFTFTSGATNQSAATLFGDDYAVNYRKEIVIDSGVELGATSTSEEALEIPSGGSGTIVVTNNGTLSGAGGAAGQAGGDAFETAVACTLINNGIIRAGGGGGGTGGQGSYSYTASSTQYDGNLYRWITRNYSQNNHQVRWAGTYLMGSSSYWGYLVSPFVITSGGYTYTRTGSSQNNQWGYDGQPIRWYAINRSYPATGYANGGSGGVGQGYSQSLSSGAAGSNNSGAGGSGGSFGQAGGSGVNGNYTNGTGGGASGASVRGYSFITLTQTGSFLGAVA